MMEELSDKQPELLGTKHDDVTQIAHQLQEAAQTNVTAANGSESLVVLRQTQAQKTPINTPIAACLPEPAPLPKFISPNEKHQDTLLTQAPTLGTSSITVTPLNSASSPSQKMASKQPLAQQFSGVSQFQNLPPGQVQTAYEAKSHPANSSSEGGGLFSWISGHSLVSKVIEKTKSSMETVITTLDPGMREILKSGGEIDIVVTSSKDAKVGPILEAFQSTFGRATVSGKESSAKTASQPVGFAAGLKGAEERIQNLRQGGMVSESQTVVSIEGFIVELLPDKWFEMSCVLLQDPIHHINLQTFSQPTPIPVEYVSRAQDRTPSDYPLRWSGLAITIGQIVEEDQPHIGRADWQQALAGVSRRESLLMTANMLAYLYKCRFPTSFVS